MKRDKSFIDSPVSFGKDLMEPDRLQTRMTSEVLSGIAGGEWRKEVERIRSLPYDSEKQRRAKKSLPYVVWSGIFSRRETAGLTRHSGLIGIDLDGLKPSQAKKVFHTAVDDDFCLAAWRSVRSGMWLLFRIPPCSASEHYHVFRQTAQHVKAVYGVAPDTQCSDVSRACFVSYDADIWIHSTAQELPIEIPALSPAPTRPKSIPRAKVKAGETWTLKAGSPITHARLVGSDHTPLIKKADGYFYTHKPLLKLATSLALTAAKANPSKKDPEQMLEEAFFGWWTEAQRHDRPLCRSPSTYRRELGRAFYDAFKKDWFQGAATMWTQRTQHPDFPHHGTKRERLLFAIRSYCEANQTKKFYLSSRDAATVIGAKSTRTAWKLLRALKDEGILSLAGRPHGQRQAHTYIFNCRPGQ